MTDIREAHEGDLDTLLELYLDLHEQSIPEHDGRLRDTWVRILADPDHHLTSYASTMGPSSPHAYASSFRI